MSAGNAFALGTLAAAPLWVWIGVQIGRRLARWEARANGSAGRAPLEQRE